jgi:hypothetical protein
MVLNAKPPLLHSKRGFWIYGHIKHNLISIVYVDDGNLVLYHNLLVNKILWVEMKP